MPNRQLVAVGVGLLDVEVPPSGFVRGERRLDDTGLRIACRAKYFILSRTLKSGPHDPLYNLVSFIFAILQIKQAELGRITGR